MTSYVHREAEGAFRRVVVRDQLTRETFAFDDAEDAVAHIEATFNDAPAHIAELVEELAEALRQGYTIPKTEGILSLRIRLETDE